MEVIVGALWRLRRLINEQEIRILVLLSLALQIILIFLAILRKRSANKLLGFVLWCSYLGADYVATTALGYLLYKGAPQLRQTITTDLRSFWAPFLLIHLGGPDTITSYSVEDNELWWRHCLGLIVQVSVASFVLLETHYGHRLWIATAAVFVIGILKYGERTLCLRSSSMDQLRDSVEKHWFDKLAEENFEIGEHHVYVDIHKEMVGHLAAGQPLTIGNEERPHKLPLYNAAVSAIGEMDQIKIAYKFFRIVKCLATDQKLKDHDKEYCQCLSIFEQNHTQAFKLVEIELSFLYDTLHTKSIHVHSITGRLLRAFVLGTTIGTLLLFIFTSKEGYKEIDVKITYALLIAAVGLEVISIVLLILSDWTIAILLDFLTYVFPGNFIPDWKIIVRKQLARAMFAVVRYFLPNGKPYWSNSMKQYQLITFCLRDGPTFFKKVLKFLKMKNMWDKFWFLDHKNVPDKLKRFIFNKVGEKARSEKEPKSYKSLRDFSGELVQKIGPCPELEWSMLKKFDESVILWHIATYICYHKNKSELGITDDSSELGLPDIETTKSLSVVSKYISNYMLYLLVFQPSMVPAGRANTRIKKTCDEAKNFLRKQDSTITEEEASKKLLEQAMSALIEDTTGDKSVLGNSLRLAKQLLNLNNAETRWRIISAVWMEMLGYAAVNCGANYHIKQLNRGGELLTHCWLLMVQMGIDE